MKAVECGLKDFEYFFVAVVQHVAGQPGENLQDALRARRGAVAQLGIERDGGGTRPLHRIANLALNERLDE